MRVQQDGLTLMGLMVGPHHPAFDNWFEMADRYGFKTVVIGRDLPEFIPFYTKWKCILDYVRTLDDDQLVFYLDPLDAFVCDYPDRILEKYRSYQTPLVIGAEAGPYPSHDFPVPDPVWRWGNNGMMIGPAGVIREAYERGYELEDWEAFGEVSDQHALIKYVLLPENLGKCTVDYRRTIVANMPIWNDANMLDQYDRQRRYVKSNGDPAIERASVLHFFARNFIGYNRFAELYGLKTVPWREALMQSSDPA